MRDASCTGPADLRWPRCWRMLLIGLCTLILCSCRGLDQAAYDTSAVEAPACPQTAASLPPEAYTGGPVQPLVGPPGMEQGVPLPYTPSGPWAPPGIRQPWPEDEYLRDGGDHGLPARVKKDWEVTGLELEDTIAHYDTVDGQRVVEPSNQVHIYSPRFGAVRQVVGSVAYERARRLAGVHSPEVLAGPTTIQPVAASKQNLQTGRQIGTKPLAIYRSRQGDGVMSSAIWPKGFQDAFKPYENLRTVRTGMIDSAELAWLAQGHTAAVAWEHDQAVQVVLDRQAAMADVSDQSVSSLFTAKAPPGEARLQVVKVASTPFAEPGDEVAFTIRFDNVGTQPIGNVTIIDNLTSRLEYVLDSAQCSVEAEFLTQPNEGDSLVIRCEVANPLQPGQGGILRFRCRVR
ncbi:MAG: DUF11 domain-containing protein [Pirellulales bacterium]|nr:DUF11 domain-containing protein [Pirellulales bacterium]